MLNKPKPGSEGSSDFRNLLRELADEVDDENVAALSDDEQLLEAIARELLMLERDLTLPGTGVSEAARVERLSQFISDKNF